MQTENLWWVIVPMKDTRLAKSRLGGPAVDRRELAVSMARDTLHAITNTPEVGGAIVVCDHEGDVASFSAPGVTVVVRHGLGLNEAILAGASIVRSEDPNRHLAALPGDLPYLQPIQLQAALAQAAKFLNTCVADRHGLGTTLLTARRGAELKPSFGVDSLRRHRSQGSVELSIPVWSGLRCDVDVAADLIFTFPLGRHTRRVLQKVETRRLTGANLI